MTLTALGLGLAVLAGACSADSNRTLTSPTGAASSGLAVQPSGPNETLPLPIVEIDTTQCGSVTIDWSNDPTKSGHTAQLWQVQISGKDATNFDAPLSFDDSQYSTTSLTLSLEPGTYLVRVRAKSNEPHVNQSGFTEAIAFTVEECSSGCTYTQGYWKNHPDDWPVNSLMLGTVSYTAGELLGIFDTPVAGNGLTSLAHQLIAAKLNIANGASDSAIASTIAAADALIGGLVVPPVGAGYLDPSTTSGLTDTLDDYNNGVIGPGHCQ